MQDFLVLWLFCQLPNATGSNVTNLMQPIFILHKYMFYDVIPCPARSELHLYMDLTYHVL